MRVMRNKNDWMQKKSIIIIILVVLLLVAILAVAAELGMKSGGRPNKIIEKIRVGNEKEQVVAFEFITQCDKCGKLKRIIFD